MWKLINSVRKSIFKPNLLRPIGISAVSIESIILLHLESIDGVNASKINSVCSFKEIGLDSLALIEMYSDLEEKFKVSLSDEETEDVQGVQDLVKVIISKLSQ